MTQLSDSSMSSTSFSQSQIADDLGEPFIPREQPLRTWVPIPNPPEWIELPDPGDDIPMPPDENSSDEVEEGDKPRAKIVDARTDLPDARRRQRKRTRVAPSNRGATLPQNEELENLFEIARQRFSSRSGPVVPDDDSSGFLPVPYDDGPGSEPDIERLRGERRRIGSDVESSDEAPDFRRRVSLSGEEIELEPTRSLMGADTPLGGFGLESPFPGVKFAVEATPRRSVENSITTETINTLNRIRQGIGEQPTISFDRAFAGLSRHGAALAFYHAVVLRSTGAIGLNQDRPFGPIEIQPGRQFSLGA
jgi:hypothetical protein